jgi:hypothetical protein
MNSEVAMIGGESLDVQSLRIPCGMKWLSHRGPSFRHILQIPTLERDLFRLDIFFGDCTLHQFFKDKGEHLPAQLFSIGVFAFRVFGVDELANRNLTIFMHLGLLTS